MKLELKHWLAYSGNNTLVYGSSDLFTLKSAVKYGDEIVLYLFHPIYGDCTGSDLEYSLCLYPYEYLTKEIEVNGDRFVPIVELAKIADCHFKLVPELLEIKQFVEDSCNVIQVHWKDSRYDYFEMSWGIDDNKFSDGKNDGYTFSLGLTYICHNVGTIYQKLFEWKFNVFNLPEELWIDINTLIK